MGEYSKTPYRLGPAKPANTTAPKTPQALQQSKTQPARNTNQLSTAPKRSVQVDIPNTTSPSTISCTRPTGRVRQEGGRHTPFFTGYTPQFYIRTSDITGKIALPAGIEMVMPGDNITMTIDLITPVAVEEGLRFAIREGGRTVGAGVFTKLLE